VGIPAGGSISVDTATPVGLTRLLCADTDPAHPIFTDAEIAAFVTLEGFPRLAAALALETIASSEALVSKKIRTQDGLSTDGPAVAAELRARAQSLREQAAIRGEVAGNAAATVMPVVSFPDPPPERRIW
jgi:hypothetical protein